jgi:cell division protease FtsH
LLAARKNQELVTMADVEAAKDKVMMGVERKSMVMTSEERKLTAYHEAGHAIVALHLPASDPVHKATIIPRGQALGLVMRLPETDRLSVTRARLDADIAVAMGGRVAEELIFGGDNVTTGASSDIQQATKMARRMVMQWGMSAAVGPILHGQTQEEVFLGYSLGNREHMSEETARLIDAEVKRIVEQGLHTARDILTTYSYELEGLAQGLLEYETLSGDEIRGLLEGRRPVRDGDNEGLLSSPKRTQTFAV